MREAMLDDRADGEVCQQANAAEPWSSCTRELMNTGWAEPAVAGRGGFPFILAVRTRGHSWTKQIIDTFARGLRAGRVDEGSAAQRSGVELRIGSCDHPVLSG
jgi:hypothetical protein